MSSRVPVSLVALAAVAVAGSTALTVQMSPSADAAPTPAGPSRYVDRARLIRDVYTLAAPAFEGRRTGTPGARGARDWLAREFEAIGLEPGGTDEYLQSFTIPAREPGAIPDESAGAAEYMAANVVGQVTGLVTRNRTLVVTAHYDHLGIRAGVLYPGADDNASGVAVLLAAARYLTQNPPRHTVVFAALDAEELGLHGAQALLDSRLVSPPAMIALINLDMVGRSDRNEVYAAGTSHSPWLRPVLEDVQTRASVQIRFGHDQPRDALGLEDWTHASDHGPFHDAGVPFVYFGVENHRDYHAASDTPDHIDGRFFGDAADMIVDTLHTFDTHLE